MGIWDKVKRDKEPAEDSSSNLGNRYINNLNEGFELIKKLLPQKKEADRNLTKVNRLNDMLDRKIMLLLKNVEIEDPLQLSQQLQYISDQIEEYRKVQLLMNRTVIGIGGKFSAGKSCFINSLLQKGEGSEIVLPEDQDATTSIPTYIVRGTVSENYAYVNSGNKVILDEEAVQAMTHAFDKAYHIGFSRFVKNLVIQTPRFPKLLGDKAVLLDTPGYNKADVDTSDSLTDQILAEEQLKSVDYLIWVIDINNGTITQSDADFIRRVEQGKKILLILNKADKVTEKEREEIVTECKRVAKEDYGLTLFGVTAYNAREGLEYLGNNLVDEFLKSAEEYSEQKKTLKMELANIIKTINQAFDKTINNTYRKKNALGIAIFKAEDILSIHSLVSTYEELTQLQNGLFGNSKEFKSITDKINKTLQDLLEGNSDLTAGTMQAPDVVRKIVK